jgi:Protein of unknown function (DUF3309)
VADFAARFIAIYRLRSVTESGRRSRLTHRAQRNQRPTESRTQHRADGTFPCGTHSLRIGFCTEASEMRLILLIILVIVVIGALPSWPYSAGWGYYPSGGLGTILVILIVLVLVGVI